MISDQLGEGKILIKREFNFVNSIPFVCLVISYHIYVELCPSQDLFHRLDPSAKGASIKWEKSKGNYVY